jgi:hypothetical protein
LLVVVEIFGAVAGDEQQKVESGKWKVESGKFIERIKSCFF